MSSCNFAKVSISNPAEFEVLVCAGTLPRHTRKMVVLSCYISPGYTVSRGKDFITDAVLEMKRKFRDPYLIVAGDFNQWEIGAALSDYHDIREADIGPTRGSRSIDKIFTNFGDHVIEAGSYPPLEMDAATEERIRRSHKIAHISAEHPRFGSFKRLAYSCHYLDP